MRKILIYVAVSFLFVTFSVKGGFAMEITSPEFKNNEAIPRKFTCQGADASPTLNISDVPSNAKSLVLIVDDPDAPAGNWDHWLIYNISPTTSMISENTIPGLQCLNDFGRKQWGGPCPPSGTHRYFFKLYALDIELKKLPDSSRKADLLKAMEGHIVAQAQLIGLYKKSY
jgi:Raf kinase inhibitor-like YbhB/YbcL family protein